MNLGIIQPKAPIPTTSKTKRISLTLLELFPEVAAEAVVDV